MSDLGLFASRFHRSTDSLRRFNSAIRYFRRQDVDKGSEETTQQVQKLLFVLRPISELLDGRLSESNELDEHSLIEILRRRHRTDWQTYRWRIIQLTRRLDSHAVDVLPNDFDVLNDVADAVDTECANLFKRIRGRV